ncbi:MAG: two-component hybrid sensor and regulator [Geminicoccaceae bacterium]|jgi:signal transduction histidine kinase/CheY-like chemotaxis protein|nr:two-component hybrid sensor and regulator [Geminicoccaceae bacterium]
MHRLLRRQLKKYLGIEGEVPAALQPFVAAVGAAYADFDSDRAMLERSLELSSKELSDARDEATAARRRLTDALESISEGFFLYDADDRMVLCNSRYRDLYPGMADVYKPGLQFEQMVRTVAERSIVADAVARPQEWVEERIARHRQPSGAFLQPQRDGRWIQISERKTQDGGTVGVFTDVTELKRREEEVAAARDEAMQATQAKSQFLASMSHELRTPLNAIIGYSEMLYEEAEDRGHLGFLPDLEKIREAGKHLLSLINAVLDLSKIEAGKMDVVVEEFEVGELIAQVRSVIEPLVARNGNVLEVVCAPQLGRMRSDPTKLRQNLLNLLSNAAKFTEGGRITLTARRIAASDGDRLQFDVADTGIGMTREQLERLFLAFSQAGATTSRDHGGTGLGLAITRHFCRLLGGDVTAESTPARGSTFTMTLPAVCPAAGPEVAAPTARSSAAEAQGTVLIIDDEQPAHDLLGEELAAAGYQVLHAAGGREGLRFARQAQPDLITLDIIMPDLDGWSVLKALKDDAALRDIPVVLVTIMGDRDLGFALGAADYITKPFDREVLLRAVARHVRAGDGRAQVLVVDDDTKSRDVLRRTLQKAGWSVAEAASGAEAIAVLERARPALILLDLMMPGMDGFEVLERLHGHAAWREVPVIIVTAKDLTRDDVERLNGRVVKVLQKGAYQRRDLVRDIRAMMARRPRPASPAGSGAGERHEAAAPRRR